MSSEEPGQPRRSGQIALTHGEEEVLARIAAGATRDDAAEALGIGTAEVDALVASALHKLHDLDARRHGPSTDGDNPTG